MGSKVSQKGPRRIAGLRRVRTALLMAFGMAAGLGGAIATEYDLTKHDSYEIPNDIPGHSLEKAIVSNHFTQPTGTGVFDPFLTLDANGQTSTTSKSIESAYNSDASNPPLDALRPEWNSSIKFSSLADIKIGTKTYYGFELDANEPDGNKRTLSVDNIRIYTSSTDNTASVGNDLSKLDNLGTLRWALNDPTKNGGSFNTDDWIKLDASQDGVSNGNGGQGQSDMILLVPAESFTGTKPTDYVWFYNLNGVQCAVDKQLAAQAGYEEWRYVAGPHHTDVPDGGATVLMLGAGLFGLAGLGRKLKK